MDGHGHEFKSESVSEADQDTDSGNVMTSDTDTSSDNGMFENHGLGQLSDTRVHPSLESSRSVYGLVIMGI